ncbi:MAG: ATP-binding protein [Bacteroidales bacterium]
MITPGMHRLLAVIALWAFTWNGAGAQFLDEGQEDLSLQGQGKEQRREMLLGLGRKYMESDRNKAISYYKMAIDLTEDPFQQGTLYDTIGVLSWRSGNYEEALDYYLQARDDFELVEDSIWLGKVYNNIAVVYTNMGYKNEAMRNYQIALGYRERLGDIRGQSLIHNNIGLIFQDWGLKEEAFKMHWRGLRLALLSGNDGAIAYSYTSLGECYELDEKPDSALHYHKLGLARIQRTGETNSYTYYYTNIGEAFKKMGRLDSAEINFSQALWYAEQYKNKHRQAVAEHHLGDVYLMKGNLDRARMYARKSYLNSLENSYPELLSQNGFVLAEIEEKSGHVEMAYSYFKKASLLRDSLFNADELAGITELQVRNHVEEESRENLVLRQNIQIRDMTIQRQKNFRMILLAGGTLVLAILFLVIRSRRTFRNLTFQLQESELELRRMNDSKDKFFSIISHDLKSPFNGMLGITKVLESKFDERPPEQTRELIHLLRRTTEQQYEFVQELLQWARTQTGKMEYKSERIDVRLLCGHVLELLTPSARNKQINLENRVQESQFIWADFKAVETVLRNLVSNAIKFTEKGGWVTLATREQERMLIVSVTDTGIGMTEEQRENLFRIDVQQSAKGTQKETGTGLGLIICKEFVEQQGGQIWVKSAPGEGSTFSFSLPTSPPAPAQSPER